MADPGESTDSGNAGSEGATASGNVDAGSDGSGGGEAKPDSDPPTSKVGSGREDTEDKPADDAKVDEEKKPEPGTGLPKHSLAIPVFRFPGREEVTAPGWPDPSAFFIPVEVQLPLIDDFLRALSQPEPTPTPGPAFRGGQEAPVIDVAGGAGGGGGGGVEPTAADSGSPPVFRVPLVVAPAVPIPGRVAPTTPLGGPTAGGPPPAASAPTAVAGANAPTVRGSLSPKAETPKTQMTPMSGQATRLGYPRSLRNPTVGQLAVVALPGVGGLMFLTFSGGVIGYRQANSLRFIRTPGAERFLY
jgi:hypothetical protein